MNTQMKTSNRKTRFSHFALALSLSLGTVGGMMGFIAITEPAFAAAAGGGGGGGGGAGGGANGGGEASVMSVSRGPALPNNPPIVRRSTPVTANGCTTARNTPDLQNCHYGERGTPRIVNIHGFANCAVIGQLPGANGRGEFYCLRPM
ncbi:MAG: hypothetical protein CFE31_09170 [Rhizobiales bacterium PAR1]|nr:MAG: hypothetical protein CFE31_09170 [Rhizobiales bacterium PAR1]